MIHELRNHEQADLAWSQFQGAQTRELGSDSGMTATIEFTKAYSESDE